MTNSNQGVVQMKRIVFAISSIFCLQAAFIGYNLGDPAAEQSFVRTDEAAAEVLTASALEVPFADEVEVAAVDGSYLSEQDETPAALPAAVRAVRAVVAPERVAVRRVRRPDRNTFVMNASAIRPVRIQYKTYDAVAFREQPAPRLTRTEYPQTADVLSERRQFEASAKIAPRKKKGFFAKSLNVIKKPYDWLKAVGSAIK